MSDTYVKPAEAGLASEARAVGRKIGKLLDSLGDVNRWIAEGTISDECSDFRQAMIEKLVQNGWRVTIPANSYRVLPPLTGEALKRDVAKARKQECKCCNRPIGEAKYRRHSDGTVRHLEACPGARS